MYLQGGGFCGKLAQDGALAQLGERLHGMQEVVGSSPIGSISLSLTSVLRKSRLSMYTKDGRVRFNDPPTTNYIPCLYIS